MSTSTYEPALDLKQVRPHPANPRRDAAADEEMIASVKAQGLLQPLVVAPASDGDGYVILAGHRRLNALKKARKKTAPALVRSDVKTDGEQIEFAVIENVHRVDLTPIEEAEAFEQLRGLKYTQTEIAKKTGRPVATVRDRLKLLKLSKKTQESVHAGQLTLGHALDLVSFDDDPKTQTKLVKAAEGPNFAYELESAKRRRAQQQKNDALVAELVALGVEETKLEKGQHTWQLSPGFKSVYENDFAVATKEHKDCLTFVTTSDSYSGAVLHLFCTKPTKHAPKDTAAPSGEPVVDEEWEREQAERRVRREAEEISAQLRVTSVLNLIGPGLKLDPRFVDVARALLPKLLLSIESYFGLDGYFDAAGVPEEERWLSYGDDRAEKAAAHLEQIANGSPYVVGRAIFALLLSEIEGTLRENDEDDERACNRRYFALLGGIGHDFTEVDIELRTAAAAAVEPEADDEAVDPYDLVHTKGSTGEPGVETPCGLHATVGKSLVTNPEADNVNCVVCHAALEEQAS